MFGLTIQQLIMVLILVIFTLAPIFLLAFTKYFRDNGEDKGTEE